MRRSRTLISITSIVSTFALLISPAFGGNDKNYTYLALGDSVAFGTLDPKFAGSPSAADFIGYPEVFAGWEHLLQSKKEVNAACPGETSGSFINGLPPDAGCYAFKSISS